MPQQFIVRGTISDEQQRPLTNVLVRAFDKDLPSLERDQFLAAAVTNTDGAYEITFDEEQFRAHEHHRADLYIEVLGTDNLLLGRSTTRFNPDPIENIDMVVEAAEVEWSEYERELAALIPLIEPLTLADITAEDVSFLVNDTGADAQQVAWLAAATALERDTGIPAAAFYGWARLEPAIPPEWLRVPETADPAERRELLAALLSRLVATSPDELVNALLASIEQNIIPAALRLDIAAIVRILRRTPLAPQQVVGRLRDERTGSPLPGRMVTISDLESPDDAEEIGRETTSDAGLFALRFAAQAAGQEPASRRLRVSMLNATGNQTWSIELRVTAGMAEVIEIPVPTPPPVEPEAHLLERLTADTHIEAPAELLQFLSDSNIRSLGDIRRRGGLGHLEGLPVAGDDPTVRTLEAHADLARLSHDVAANATLIGQGFHSVADIAATPMPDFVNALHETMGDFPAARLQVDASAQTTFLRNLLTGLAVERANGYHVTESALLDGPAAKDAVPRRCGCDDCEAAVSPTAYLADLLNYTATHLKENGKRTDLAYLEHTFHQPFGGLPTDCEAVDEMIRQARLCIEVLRSHVIQHPPAAVAAAQLEKATKEYLLSTYGRVLMQLGTSYEEVRLARTAPAEVRQALAERLGVDLTLPRPDPLTSDGDELDQLFLNGDTAPPDRRALTERALERLIGLVDTTRDPLSDGVKIGDNEAAPELSRWSFAGASWTRNTDTEGLSYLRVKNFVTSMVESQVEVYRDSGRTELVATGMSKVLTGSRTVKLVAKNGSGLSGAVTVSGLSADNTDISVALLPRLPLWRLRHLRSIWREQDFPRDVFSGDYSPAFDRRPIVDPDVIGPDDFRRPEPTQPLFGIWRTRRLWIDQRINELTALTKNIMLGADTLTMPDLDQVFARMYAAQTYGPTSLTPWLATTPVTQFDILAETFEHGTTADVAVVGERVSRDLNLSADAFVQIMRIRVKQLQWEMDPKSEMVQSDEWSDLFSLLVRAEKRRFIPAWIAEELAAAVRLGPEDFWPSLRAPREGTWPPVAAAGQPLVDPDETKLTELPEPTTGEAAIQIWQARRAALTAAAAAIRKERESNGFDAMLRVALGHPSSGNPLQYDLASIRADLTSAVPATAAAAGEKVTRDLRLTVETFNRVLTMMAKAAPDSPRLPSPAEWAELYTLLTAAFKKKHLYPSWLGEETAAGLTAEYWRAVKAELPRSRVTAEERQEWQHALQTRSRPSIIDPDAIDPTTPGGLVTEPALTIWQTRRNWVTDTVADMAAEPKTVAGFDAIVEDRIAIPIADLLVLDQRRQAGVAIQTRLDQFPLTNGAFTYLLRIRELLAAGQPVLDAEWAAVHSILVQVAKRRLTAQWREEERQAAITLSPDFFASPDATTSQPIPPELRWRISQEDRFDWLDALQSRVNQERTVLAACHDLIATVEESELPVLRAGLVAAAGVGVEPDAKASWVTDRMLIDALAGGCQRTTRIAQAIETLHTLLFTAHTSQSAALQTLNLSLDAPDFDEEWRWIGSYATWRAAMFVCMYPENIAVGNLRRHQTPAFRRLVKALRSNRRLTGDQACSLAAEFAAYYEDVAKLVIGATAQANVTRRSGTPCVPGVITKEPLIFLFGRGGVSNRFYWSTFDPADTSGYAQDFWDYVPDAPEISTVAGASLYERTATDRRIFVFIRTVDQKLQFLTFDLESSRWNGPTDLALPPGDARGLDIVLDQNDYYYHPPRLTFRSGADFYFRDLNPEGTGWAEGDWKQFLLKNNDANLIGIQRLLAMVEGMLLVREDNQLEWRYTSSKLLYTGTSPARANAEYLGSIYWGTAKNSTNRWLVEKRADGTTVAQHDTTGAQTLSDQFPLSGLAFVAPNSGSINHASYGYQRRNSSPSLGGILDILLGRDEDGVYLRLVELEPTLTDRPIRSMTYRIAPRVIPCAAGQFLIPARVEGAAADVRRNTVRLVLTATGDSATNRTYPEEAYFFVPMLLCDGLRRAGEFGAALDLARTVFDYASPAGRQKIYHGLVQEESLPAVFKRAPDWLQDPLDPHAIAATRQLTYTRFALLQLVQLLLDYADDEFTQDTSESVPRARTLYLTALAVLNLPELHQQLGQCRDLIGEIDIALGPDVPPKVAPGIGSVIADLHKLKNYTALQALVPKVKGALTADVVWEDRLARARELVDEAAIAEPPPPTMAGALQISAAATAQAYARVLTSPTVTVAAAEAGQLVGVHFLNSVANTARVPVDALVGNTVQLPWLRSSILRTGDSEVDFVLSPDLQPIAPPDSPSLAGMFGPVLQTEKVRPGAHLHFPAVPAPQPMPPPPPTKPTPGPSLAFCVPPNPLLAALRLRAELNLLKIRTCRNIAGMKRELDPYAAPTDTTTGLPTIGASGQLVLPGTSVLRPTLYRFPVLVQRAKELVAIGQQIESSMLSMLEKRDAEAYSMQRARQDLELAQAGVQLEVVRLRQANDGVTLASLQQARAQIQLNHYDKLLDEGLIELERGAIETLGEAALLQAEAATWSFLAAAGFGVAAMVGPLSGAAAAAASSLGAISAGHSSNAAKRSTRAQIQLIQASFERRRQEWELSASLAKQDVAIGAQQVTIATDAVDIVKQEKAIAEIRNTHAKDTVAFLANKFTNVELYDWMSDVLEGVYSFFLQQATSTARLAENQLAFERQEPPAALIQSDYWQALDDSMPSDNTQAAPVDRHGLTGSARLLQDLYRLDQYAFDTNKRKLQLSKTLSLALMAPSEFQQFRETGVMRFATPMGLFDRDFPGHYLRLIRNVSMSVVALVPPTEGIHATLSSGGVSRVVIGPDVFQTTPIRRDPELVALTSPTNASGVLELDPQNLGMLQPFEGSGVDTSWELRMPKAANFFDYRSLADVLMKFDYTALPSWDYSRQVIDSMRQTTSGDRPFSFRNELADQWYDLHNPEQTTTPMVVKFQTLLQDFPPNISSLKIQHVVLHFARRNGTLFEVPVRWLRFVEDGTPGATGGAATSIDGIISTRRGNAGSWMSLVGRHPVGDWELALPDTEEIRGRFANADIEDVLFVLTYAGRTHEWPA